MPDLAPAKPGGMHWISNWRQPIERDRWFDTSHGTASYTASRGVLSITGATPRMYVHDTRQWRDVEVTMFVRRVSDASVPYAGMTAVVRSNHGTTGDYTSDLCDTRGYGARLRFDGHADFEKETSHPSNQAVMDTVVWPDGMPRNQWIGYKFLAYDLSNGTVKLELWLSRDGNRKGWRKVNEIVDTGAFWGDTACAEGIDPRSILSNSPSRPGSESGKPNISVYFRSDGIGQLQYKWGSIREIEPPKGR